MRVSALALAAAWIALAPAYAWARDAAPRIVLIGGAKSEGPARHDYPAGIRLLAALLESSPDLPAGARIEAYPESWPGDAGLATASTIVWYFDGLEKHPLLDAPRRAAFEAAMQSGAGLVALHRSATVPEHDRSLRLGRWLGAARLGMPDRVTERVLVEPVAPQHPVSRGLQRTRYHDELFPTLRFARSPRAVPIANAVARDRTFPAAWVAERSDGGRSFGYSGAHYLLALDEPVVRRMILNAIFWTARLEVPAAGVRSAMPDAAMQATRAALDAAAQPAPPASPDTPTFHRDAQRTGWNAGESTLSPGNVAGPSFGALWESPPFDARGTEPPRLYASPLYIDRVPMEGGRARSVVFAATSVGDVYAVNAFASDGMGPGEILWRARLGPPCDLPLRVMDGVATGILATPVIDVARARLYATTCESGRGWQAYALDIASGAVVPGWPVALDEAALVALNTNRGRTPPAKSAGEKRLQRGALNLSPDGATLYVTFGESASGWLVAVDTARASIAGAFATVAEPHRNSGGIWGAGGAAVDAKGNVFVVTGTNFGGYVDQPHDWVQSALMLTHSAQAGLRLRGTYTPFNYCRTASFDVDLGSGGAMLLPDFDSAATATPRLMAFGGKQGNAYLVDRERMPGRLDRRPACGTDAARDGSLLAPRAQPQFGTRGPLNVFGPYSDVDGAMDVARGRSVPAYFRDAGGQAWLFFTGNMHREAGSPDPIPPSIAKLKVVAIPGEAAYLEIDRVETTVVLGNPGSPVVSSDGPRGAVVWVLDENAPRTAALVGDGAPRPVLYAFDAQSLRTLWRSPPNALRTSGKYNEPVIARGVVFVGTDRIQAFGLRP